MFDNRIKIEELSIRKFMSNKVFTNNTFEIEREKYLWSRKALKFSAWSVLLFYIGYFLLFTFGKYFPVEAKSYGLYWEKRFWLIPHIFGGTLALLVGALQFSSFIRNRFRILHRIFGRVYIAAVGIGAVGSFYLSTRSVISPTFGATMFTISVIWVISTAMAVVSIRQGRVNEHRQWMIRSYLSTLGFIFFRLLMLTPLFADTPLAERATAIGWMSLIIPFSIAEFLFQWNNSVTPVKNVGVAEINI